MNRNKSKSYLGIHLADLEKSGSPLKYEKLKPKQANDSDYGYDFDIDLDSDRESNPTESKLSNYFPRTAPVASFSKTRKSNESLTNISMADASRRNTDPSFYSSSGNILNRKKKSIRV